MAQMPVVISLMLGVPDTSAAVDWYTRALGARVLWSLGSVAGLEMAVIARAAGAEGSAVEEHTVPWGVHRQEGNLRFLTLDSALVLL